MGEFCSLEQEGRAAALPSCAFQGRGEGGGEVGSAAEGVGVAEGLGLGMGWPSGPMRRSEGMMVELVRNFL